MKYILLITIIFVSSIVNAQPLTIRHSAGGHAYPAELLKLALSKVDVQVEFIKVAKIPTQSRALRLLGEENGIDVFWGMTSSEREKIAKAVLIPIDKGLLGYRIPCIAVKNSALFKNVSHSGQLKSFSFGLREDWPDTTVFEKNDIQTVSYGKGANPYEMLTSGRFDALAHDIFDIDNIHNHNIVHDQYIAIHYPSAAYFFVDKQNTRLHQQITQGLNYAIADGSFARLFNQYFAGVIERANLQNRRIINITNPLLPPSAPIHNPKYWLTEKQLTQ